MPDFHILTTRGWRGRGKEGGRVTRGLGDVKLKD